ncbi:MAG: carbohydrate binding family 9 domain-containing protein [Proteobacteria bacterium]|nr:carbohydrate binding family 9 domain-containing protein [Pseudomonadota bacterium]
MYLLFALFLLPGAVPARAVHAASTSSPISVDGKLRESAWSAAPEHQLRRQKSPVVNGPVTQPTSFRVLAGPDAIYIGVRCEQKVPIVARRTRRDRDIESDRVIIDIDSRGRGKDAFHFEITAGGSMVDGIRYNDTTLDLQWDANWISAVSRDPDGWTVETAIPLRVLRRPADSSGPVRMQVRRYISALAETDEWARTPRDNSQEVRRYTPVRGLELQSFRLTADVLPYVSPTLQSDHESGFAPGLRYGTNLKFRFAPDSLLDATLLPDFGTVEADTAVFNLKTTEVQFPEKRPFFQEGVDLFTTPLDVFYSRRIGSLTGTTAGTVLDTGSPARVLMASKLLARAGERGALGTLVALTGKRYVRVAVPDTGLVARQQVVPRYAYTLLRGTFDLPYAGYVGLLAGSRNALESGLEAPWPSCPDAQQPVAGRCFHDSYLVAADMLARSRDGRLQAVAQIVGTYRYAGTPRTQLDGNVLSSGDLGGAARVQLKKTGGRVIGWINYEWRGRDADWNATGYLPVPNRHHLRMHVALQDLVPRGLVLEDRWQVELWRKITLEGFNAGVGYQANYRAKWKNFWQSFTELHYRPRHLDNREARDGTLVQRSALVGWEQIITTDHRRKVVGELDGVVKLRTTGGWLHNGWLATATLNVDVAAFGSLQLRLGINGTYDVGELRWLEADLEHELRRFARLDARALGLLTRVNYTITPRLELQLYGQLLGAGIDRYNATTSPASARRVLLDQVIEQPRFGRHHSNETLLIVNAFLRWEYSPGSNLYLVMTRNHSGSSEENSTIINVTPLNTQRPAYLFLVKLTSLLEL